VPDVTPSDKKLKNSQVSAVSGVSVISQLSLIKESIVEDVESERIPQDNSPFAIAKELKDRARGNKTAREQAGKTKKSAKEEEKEAKKATASAKAAHPPLQKSRSSVLPSSADRVSKSRNLERKGKKSNDTFETSSVYS